MSEQAYSDTNIPQVSYLFSSHSSFSASSRHQQERTYHALDAQRVARFQRPADGIAEDPALLIPDVTGLLPELFLLQTMLLKSLKMVSETPFRWHLARFV
jgi:hypothetical protein